MGGISQVCRAVLSRAETLLKLGEIEPFTYILGAHVLRKIEALGASWPSALLTLEDLGKDALYGDGGAVIAGSVWENADKGFSRADAAQPSPRYVEALQELHFHGILLNDIRPPALDREGAEKTHFTTRHGGTPGVSWDNRTPVMYKIPLEAANGAL